MIYIVFMILLTAFTLAGVFLLPSILNSSFADADLSRNEASRLRAQQTRTLIVRSIFVGIFVVVGGVLTVARSVKVVEAGHVGLVYRFGDIVGQRDAGLSLIWPWESFKTADIRIQKVRPDSDCANGFEECLEAFSSETQDVFVVATANISVNPDAVQQLYRTVGPDYDDKLVRPRLLQIFKDETVKYRSVDIAPAREMIRAAVARPAARRARRFFDQRRRPADRKPRLPRGVQADDRGEADRVAGSAAPAGADRCPRSRGAAEGGRGHGRTPTSCASRRRVRPTRTGSSTSR